MIQYRPFCLTIWTPFIVAIFIPLSNGMNVRSARRFGYAPRLLIGHFHLRFPPILLRLALHRWRCRVFELQPVLGAAADVWRAAPLRHDALAADFTGVAKDGVAAMREVLDEPYPWPAPA